MLDIRPYNNCLQKKAPYCLFFCRIKVITTTTKKILEISTKAIVVFEDESIKVLEVVVEEFVKSIFCTQSQCA